MPTKGEYKKVKHLYEDIEREIVEDDEIVKDVIDTKTQEQIVRQVDEEYNLAYKFNQAKRTNMLLRLKLYNNQRRDADAVGDPLMFTVFNTIHASLYDDRLKALWEGRGGEGDEDVEDNLNALSDYDYDIMGKSEFDYYWNWDAEFFGRSLCLMMDFDRTQGIMAPIPELLDPITFVRDPRASSVNGDMRGKGAMRFGGWEVGATYYELKNLPAYFNIQSLRKDKDVNSLLDEAKAARRLAQGNQDESNTEESLGKFNNYEFQLLNWVTTIRGEKYLVTLGNRRTTLIRLMPLKKYGERWPIIDRTLYPMSNDWDGVSIPDLTEDKQRMRAVLLNLGVKSAKADVIGQRLYDKTRIKNANDLNFSDRKFIGVDGRVDNAIAPVRQPTAHQHINLIMDILDTAAQRSTAATEVRQGIQSDEKRTLGEQQLAINAGNIRFNMSAKVYGWSEKAFWRQWYKLYKVHFKENIDEKVVRIQGALAPVWRPLTRENIISDVDPDVKIESRVVSEGKKQAERQGFTAFASIAIQNPENNRRFIEKKLARLNNLTSEEISMIFRKTPDEIQAEDENNQLNQNKMPNIGLRDDHLTHLQVHAKANQNPQSVVHMQLHKQAMIRKRNRPDLFPVPQPMNAQVVNEPMQRQTMPQLQPLAI